MRKIPMSKQPRELKKDELMKTHRQALIEQLQVEFPKTLNVTPARVEHLLLFADMLDERADQFRDATKKIETNAVAFCDDCGKAATIWDASFGTFCADCAPAIVSERGDEIGATPTNKAHAFPDELIARLRHVQQNTIRESLERDGECHPDVALRAVLAELAKTPVELPSDDATAERLADRWVREDGGENAKEDEIVAVRRALKWAGNRVVPMVAAKDAAIAALIAEANCDAEKTLAIRIEREQQAKCIADLEKQIAEKEQANVIIVDGKTPGEVFVEAYETEVSRIGSTQLIKYGQYHPNLQAVVKIGANAVLRAFGGEALRRVRERVDKLESFDVQNNEGQNDYAVLLDEVFAIVDDERAKLGSSVTSNATEEIGTLV